MASLYKFLDSSDYYIRECYGKYNSNNYGSFAFYLAYNEACAHLNSVQINYTFPLRIIQDDRDSFPLFSNRNDYIHMIKERFFCLARLMQYLKAKGKNKGTKGERHETHDHNLRSPDGMDDTGNCRRCGNNRNQPDYFSVLWICCSDRGRPIDSRSDPVLRDDQRSIRENGKRACVTRW